MISQRAERQNSMVPLLSFLSLFARGTGYCFSDGVERGFKADLSPPASTKVKNARTYNSNPSY